MRGEEGVTGRMGGDGKGGKRKGEREGEGKAEKLAPHGHF